MSTYTFTVAAPTRLDDMSGNTAAYRETKAMPCTCVQTYVLYLASSTCACYGYEVHILHVRTYVNTVLTYAYVHPNSPLVLTLLHDAYIRTYVRTCCMFLFIPLHVGEICSYEHAIVPRQPVSDSVQCVLPLVQGSPHWIQHKSQFIPHPDFDTCLVCIHCIRTYCMYVHTMYTSIHVQN